MRVKSRFPTRWDIQLALSSEDQESMHLLEGPLEVWINSRDGGRDACARMKHKDKKSHHSFDIVLVPTYDMMNRVRGCAYHRPYTLAVEQIHEIQTTPWNFFFRDFPFRSIFFESESKIASEFDNFDFFGGGLDRLGGFNLKLALTLAFRPIEGLY